MKPRHSRKIKNGFSVLEVVVSMGILTVVAMGVLYTSIFAAKARKTNTSRISAENIRYLFETGVKGSISWTQTIPLNSSMSCLAPGGGACAAALSGVDTPFKLCMIKTDGTCDTYDPAEVTAAGTAGIDGFGKVCHGFDPINGNDDCPFHYDLFWQPICPPLGTCIGPGVYVRADLSYFPKSLKYPLNPTNFNFKLMRPPRPVTLKSVCDAANGTFDPSTNSCLTTLINSGGDQMCPPGQKLSGFNLNGSISCDPVYTAQCPSGQVIGTINSDGTLNCISSPCPLPTVECQGSWSACQGGVQTFYVTTPAQGSGGACPVPSGTTVACATAVNCIGAWSGCVGGYRTFNVSVPSSGAGAACPVPHGTIQSCGDCVGSWSVCDPATNTQFYTISTPASNGGGLCPINSGAIRNCPMISKTGNLCDLGKLGPSPGVDVQVPCL